MSEQSAIVLCDSCAEDVVEQAIRGRAERNSDLTVSAKSDSTRFGTSRRLLSASLDKSGFGKPLRLAVQAAGRVTHTAAALAGPARSRAANN